jgi:hypothetical protein
MHGELQAVVDESRIRKVLATYARAIDRMDWELLRSCYHPDAVEDRGRYRGSVDGFLEWVRETLASFESTWHLVGTPLIEIDGDVAWVESYCLGVQRTPPLADGRAEDRLIPCRYIDRFERRGGEWRIADRLAVYEPAIAVPAGGADPLGLASRRDREDPTYRRP